jgi:hypothetical protein
MEDTVESIVPVTNNNAMPTQQEIDAVAHFVEAVRELRQSPFFIEEYRNLTISSQGDEVTFKFPDHNVVSAMLVPFRRVWLQKEPCQYRKVANVIKRYMPEWRGFIDYELDLNRASCVRAFPFFQNEELSTEDVVNIWLNTKLFHAGGTAKSGQPTHEDFVRIQQRFKPPGLFEAYFLFAVDEIGLHLFNLQQCARVFLRQWLEQGLRPSFPMSGDIAESDVERRTPGFTPDHDAPQQRVWRLRRRRQYAAVSRLYDMLSLPDNVVADATLQCVSLAGLTERLGIRTEYVQDFAGINQQDFNYFSGCMDNDATIWKNRKVRTGSIARRKDGVIVWSGEAVPVIEDQYNEFRVALMRQPFS